MSMLEQVLENGGFGITAEMAPPKGCDFSHEMELAKCLNTYLPGKKVTFMMGVMADKDYVSMLDEILPMAKNFVAVRPESDRALASADLKHEIETRLRIPAIDGGSVKDGVKAALAQADKDDVIVIFGSLYQVGEVHEAFE